MTRLNFKGSPQLCKKFNFSKKMLEKKPIDIILTQFLNEDLLNFRIFLIHNSLLKFYYFKSFKLYTNLESQFKLFFLRKIVFFNNLLWYSKAIIQILRLYYFL